MAGEIDVEGASQDPDQDPDNDKYIAAAIEGRAGFLIAGDSDLLNLKEHAGVRIVSPRAFLNLLAG